MTQYSLTFSSIPHSSFLISKNSSFPKTPHFVSVFSIINRKGDYMNSVLLVSKLNSSVNALKKLLEENSYEIKSVVSDTQSALSLVDDRVYDIVLINSPLEDSDGAQLAVEICRDTVCGVMILAPSEKTAGIGERVIDYGTVVVPKPINKMLFTQSLGVVRAAQKRCAGLTLENERLRSTIEEAKIISRAKLLLIQNLSLSEERAHKYIEKQAMDLRTSKIEVARQILRTYITHKL